jgi:hypothetical protein
VASVEAYLDRVCGRLRVNPAEAEDLREELRSHLEAAIEESRTRGVGQKAAADMALASFGSPHKLHECLDRVHHGDAWWLLRLKGLALGMVVGGLLSLAISASGGSGLFTRLIPFAAAMDSARLMVLFNGLAAGGLIGLLAAGGRGLLAGWSAGALLWLAESVVWWMIGAGGGADPASNMLATVLLAPLLGGLFGAAVGAAAAAALSAASRVRPRIE